MIMDNAKFTDEDKHNKYLLRDINDIMNHKIKGWKKYKGKKGKTEDAKWRFGDDYGLQRAWERVPESVPEDFQTVPEDEEVPF